METKFEHEIIDSLAVALMDAVKSTLWRAEFDEPYLRSMYGVYVQWATETAADLTHEFLACYGDWHEDVA